MESRTAQRPRHAAEATPPQVTSRVTNVNDLPLVLTARDVQRLTRLDKTGTYALLHEAGCPTLRFGRAIRVLRDPFLAWLEQRARTNGQ